MKKRTLLIALLMSICFLLTAQRTISGKVTEYDAGEPLVGASIVIKGTTIGTLTDTAGMYSLVVPKDNMTIIISFTGYNNEEIPISSSNSINAVLKDSTLLEEVVVTGYRTVKKRDFTGSISQVVKGRLAGVSIRGSMFRQRSDKDIEPKSTEKYAHTDENDFNSPHSNPLSTFSIDVDNASYTNIRRFINSDNLPPKDAVRIEEMVNYFDYNLPQPTDVHPIAVNTELGECAWKKGHLLMKIDIQARNLPYKEAPANNFVFLLDVSGSMQSPDKITLLKKGFEIFVKQLRPIDLVSIVVYAGNAGLVLETTEGVEKDKIMAAINKLEAGGSTAGGEGIELAYKIAEQHFMQHGNNRVILATDGDFNVGISSTKALERLITKKREKNIYLSVLGFGSGNINDEGMEALADKGNGNYYYIDCVKEAEKVLCKDLTGTILTLAKDVKFQIEFNPVLVESYRLVGYENRLLNDEDFNNDAKDAGEIGAGQSVTALYEIVPKYGVLTASENKNIDPLRFQKPQIAPQNAGKEWLFIKMRYKKPLSTKSILMSESAKLQPLSMEKTSDDFRFATAVAAFGQVLRGSKFKGDFNFNKIIDLAESAKGADTEGYRQEFIDLVKKCIAIEDNN
jgi:Ca-activated chloride channel homolog